MPTYKVPATVKWSEIRALIGDKRTEDIITLKYGPTLLGPPTIKLQKVGIEHMLAHLEGRTVPGLKSGFYQAIPAIFRAYFQESPRARGKMVIWLKKKLDGIEPGAEGEGEDLAKTAEQVVAQTKRGSLKKKNKVGATA